MAFAEAKAAPDTAAKMKLQRVNTKTFVQNYLSQVFSIVNTCTNESVMNATPLGVTMIVRNKTDPERSQRSCYLLFLKRSCYEFPFRFSVLSPEPETMSLMILYSIKQERNTNNRLHFSILDLMISFSSVLIPVTIATTSGRSRISEIIVAIRVTGGKYPLSTESLKDIYRFTISHFS